MKLSEIKRKVLNGKMPFKIGQTLAVPVYKTTSRGHDPKYSSFKREWCAGKAKVRGVSTHKFGKTIYIKVSLFHQGGACKWIEDIFVNRFNVNEDLFSKKWAENYAKKLNGKYTIDIIKKFFLGGN